MKTRRPKTISDVQTEIKLAIANVTAIREYIGTITDLKALFDLDEDDLRHMPQVYPSTGYFLKEAQAAGLEIEEIEAAQIFLIQLHTMQLESWGRWIGKMNQATVGYWANYWLLMFRTHGGWDAAKEEVKRRFAGLEDEYREILNESYKEAKRNEKENSIS